MEIEHLKHNIAIWEKIVEVQMHFNELEMKIRNFAILLISAFLGGAGLALKDDVVVSNLQVPLASLLCFACVFVCAVFYFVDQIWYHPLLKGAVSQGLKIEAELGKELPYIKLAHAIGDHSKYGMLGGRFVLDSGRKIRVFYLSLAILFTLTGLVLLVSSPRIKLQAPSGVEQPTAAVTSSAAQPLYLPTHVDISAGPQGANSVISFGDFSRPSERKNSSGSPHDPSK